MKVYSSKRILAASDDEYTDDERYTLNDWADNLSYIAYRQGYDLEHNANDVEDSPDDLEVKLYPRDEMMPEVEVYVNQGSDSGKDYLYLEVNILNFPDLYADKMDYHDSWTWHINQWAKVGKLADDLSQETFVLE